MAKDLSDFDPVIADGFAPIADIDPPDTWARVWPTTTLGASITEDVRSSSIGDETGGAVRRRWIAAIAAGVIAIAGLGAMAAFGRDSRGPTSLEQATSPVLCPPLTAVDGMPAPTHPPECESFHAGPELGTANPATVEPGGTVTITPLATIQPICGDLVIVLQFQTDAFDRVGVLSPDGSWQSYREQPLPTLPACLPDLTDGPVTYKLAAELTAGSWRLCRTDADETRDGYADPAAAAGCVDITIQDPAQQADSTEVQDPGFRADGFGNASVEPAIVGPGDTITITPTSAVQPVCGSPALIRIADGQRLGVLGDSGTWVAGSDDVFRACLVDETSSPHDFVLPNPLPSELPNGAYSICLTRDFTDEGCGPLVIDGADGVTVVTNPPEQPRTGELADTLTLLGVDVDAAPIGAVVDDGGTYCGSEDTGALNDESPGVNVAGRRCLLDHQAAALPSSFISAATKDGDPIVSVWRTEADGSAEWYLDLTRVPGERDDDWIDYDCPRLSLSSDRNADLPPTAFDCSAPSGRTVDIEPTAFPEIFTTRPQAPTCGYVFAELTGPADPAASSVVSCFDARITAGEPVEVVTTFTDGPIRIARWIVHNGDGQFEITTLTIDLDGQRTREWTRQSCSSVTLNADATAQLSCT